MERKLVIGDDVTMKVDFIYDFGSPNAYLAHRVVRDIEVRTKVKFNYIPCLLGGIFKETGNRSPFLMFKDIKGKLDYDRIEINRFIRKHHLTEFKLNPHFPINTLLLMRGAIAAELENDHPAYIEAGMKAMWEDGQKMDDHEVFIDAMDKAGLDGAHYLARSQNEDVKEKLMANTSAAIERGVFGIPTFFVGKEMFFGKDRLSQVEDEISIQRRT